MKPVALFLISGALILAGCKSKTSDTQETKPSNETELIVNPEVLIQAEINVEGMSCTGCENTINDGIKELSGIVDVKSSFQDGKTIVKYDSTVTNIEEIKKVIADKGYSVKSYQEHLNPTD